MPTSLEQFGVHAEITAVPQLRTLEAVGVRGTPSVTVRELVSDTAAAHVSASGRSFARALEAVAVRIVALPKATHQSALGEAAHVRDSSYVRVAVSLTESFGAFGSTSAVVDLLLREQYGVHAAASGTQLALHLVHEQGGVRSRSYGLRYGAAVELAGVRGTSDVQNVRTLQRVTELLGAIGTASGNVQPVVRISEQLGVHALCLARTQAVAVRKERFFAYARSWPSFIPAARSFSEGADIALTSAWTADMRSWGMSRYVGLPVAEFVEHVDGVYGASPAGVYYQEGLAPVSWIETAKLAFEDQFDSRREQKRISHVYTYATHAQPLNIMVSGDYLGAYATYTYAQPAAAADSTRAVRCDVGRGFSSNFYKFRIGDSAFDMYHFEVEMAKMQRRV